MSSPNYSKGASRPPKGKASIKPLYLKAKKPRTYTVSDPHNLLISKAARAIPTLSVWSEWIYVADKNYWTRERHAVNRK